MSETGEAMQDDKFYLDARNYLRDMWRLGRQILDSGWRPDVLLALWRGGAEVGVAVHEYLKVHGLSPKHMPIKCFSYTGIGTSEAEVKFEHAQSVFDAIAPGSRVLVLDDVFDTGRTAAAMHARLEAQSMKDEICPESIIRRRTAPSPTRCFCPIYSSSVRGRIRSAKGSLIL